MEELRIEGWKEGWKEGLERGRKAAQKDTALRMLKAGKYPLDEISEITELPLEEIQKLQPEPIP